MRRRIQFAILALVLTAGAAPLCAEFPRDVKVGERLLFLLANTERTQRGLRALRWDTALAASARYHAGWMADRADISHQFPGEPELMDRASSAGAHFSAVAENVAIVSEIRSAHDEWMLSPGHRANLLDPRMDSVGIALQMRGGRFYVVQDFARNVAEMSFPQQEESVARLIRPSGVSLLTTEQAISAARRTCGMEVGFAGENRPSFIMRFTAGDLTQLPDELKQQLASGKYTAAVVGACHSDDGSGFTVYSIAVLLFSHKPPA
jgi:hypothetical protein